MTDALAAAYAHGPGKQITVGPPPDQSPAPGLRRRLPSESAVAQLILDVLTPSRWEPWNQYNDHRAYPSPRAAYLVDVEIVVADMRWPIDPLRRATIGQDTPPLHGPVRLEFKRRPDRLTSGYGEFVHALMELEIGHIAGALVENSARFGLTARADGEGVSLWPSEAQGTTLPGPREDDNHPATPGSSRLVATPRSSGIGPRGLSADPRPLPRSALSDFVEAVRNRVPGTLHHPGLRHVLAVHNVIDVPDGWYTVDPFDLVTPCAAMDIVQERHGHGRAVMDVSGMNLALITTADVPAVVSAEGEDAYPDLLRATGALAQHVCTASARAGMFCRPLRSFDDPVLEAAIGVPVSHSLLYVLLAWRPRVTGFSYDLTSLELP